MEVDILLADAADSNDGKISALGIGWAQTASPTPSMALIVRVRASVEEIGNRHQFAIELLDAEDQPEGGRDGQGVRIEGHFEVGKPTGHVDSLPIDNFFPVSIPPGLVLKEDQVHYWRVSVDGKPLATAPFYIRPS